jgi:ABC-2 type transport system ATP-binding protein
METLRAPTAASAARETTAMMIETRGLTKTFKARGKTVEAVRGVDLMVRAGEIFGLLGPNGAGKTTTMRMLATLLPPSGGAAQVAGCDLLREPRQVRNRIGYVSQSGGVAGLITGEENLLLQARLYGLSANRARQRTRELIVALELESFAKRLAKTYSGGQRRRLDVAMGLVHQPPLLFLDEPTTGLDPQSRARMWDEVRKLRGLGTTIFLTTHYLDEADALCDRLAIMDNGQVVAEGTPNELKSRISGDIISLGVEIANPAYARAREALAAQPYIREVSVAGDGLQLIVERGEEVLPDILRLLDGAGLPIRTVTLARPSLDDVFLRLTGRSLRETDQ